MKKHPTLTIRLSAFEHNPAFVQKKDNRIMHFHISRESRDAYQFDHTIFSLSGNVIFPNYQAVKEFAAKMNEKRDLEKHPEQSVKSSEINALALIDEILHYIIQLYRRQKNSKILKDALDYTSAKIGSRDKVNLTLRDFAMKFPPIKVYKNEQTLDEYFTSTTEFSAEEIELEEMLMLWIANQNPAFNKYQELFEDTLLTQATDYKAVIENLNDFFKIQPGFGSENLPLIELLLQPSKKHPKSLSKQLVFMREEWGMELLGDYFLKILMAEDFIKEETKFNFPASPRGEVITKESLLAAYDDSMHEYESFSQDKYWMPKVIMIAKNVYVWLDQLSKQYNREINTLDKIPDEELQQLSQRGFTGLWLIGLWERSQASRTIKQICGNPDAAASAYSLYDYTIAHDLGGEDALQDLKYRAWKYKIRLASDMVPNHMSIDSKWVQEHPDWFLSLDHPPYPQYSYNGVNLSSHEGTGVYVDDHYYDKTDAAVVFKRVDFNTGDTRYIYHGNDGTSMPWNDTAQLNYLKHEVREAIINTIIHIAQSFPIIRFDAAMTLTKKHYQRLWFPQPGSGGDIPTRSEHALTRQQFDEFFPKEFWREVVDRVAKQAPDTLLLAEAFWLMEGYFVRTLGMHRVYNSAFMNFMKEEDNQKFRDSIKNVLEFDPHILQRFVNFQSNPDEETAVAQFGKDDKYFGTCITMITLPGLPMFAHGQIEGLTEKYGMEYKRAYWNEISDFGLIDRHEREVFPLMHKRYIFAAIDNFFLFDLYTSHGHVNENLLAYSNRYNDEKALILYNNKFETATGWINYSAAVLEKSSGNLKQTKLADALQIPYDENSYVIFKDHITNLEFLRNCKEIHENGLYVEMGAFKYAVYMDFRVVEHTEKLPWHDLNTHLNGRGVEDAETELKYILYKTLHIAFGDVFNEKICNELLLERSRETEIKTDAKILKAIENNYNIFLEIFQDTIKSEADWNKITDRLIKDLITIINLPTLDISILDEDAHTFLEKVLKDDVYQQLMIFAWVFTARLSELTEEENSGKISNALMKEHILHTLIRHILIDLGHSPIRAKQEERHIRAFVYYQNWWRDYDNENLSALLFKDLIEDTNMHPILQLNTYHNKIYFNKEAFETFLEGLFIIGLLDILRSDLKKPAQKKSVTLIYQTISNMIEKAEIAGYEVKGFLEELEEKELDK